MRLKGLSFNPMFFNGIEVASMMNSNNLWGIPQNIITYNPRP